MKKEVFKILETKLSDYKHIMELIRTIIGLIVLVFQSLILYHILK